MIVSALFFYLFAGVCVASAVMVIVSRNPVHSVLYLILAFVNASGLGAIGTPDDAVTQIERLQKQSNGGFGAFLQLAHDWAAPAANSTI